MLKPLSKLSLTLILVLAGLLRFHGLKWDAGLFSHPDESFLVMVAQKISLPHSLRLYLQSDVSPFNPVNRGFNFYVYGTFPLLFIRLVADLFALNSAANLLIVGRLFSAALDTGSVLIVYLIARRLYIPAALPAALLGQQQF